MIDRISGIDTCPVFEEAAEITAYNEGYGIVDEKLMKPIIIKSLCALNNIYQVFNTQIDDNNLKRLQKMNTFINNTYI